MADPDFYRTLRVHRNATEAEIKAAFRSQAKRLHPDLNRSPGAEASFKALNEAYATLSSAPSRRDYDARHRHAGLPPGAPPSDWARYMRRPHTESWGGPRAGSSAPPPPPPSHEHIKRAAWAARMAREALARGWAGGAKRPPHDAARAAAAAAAALAAARAAAHADRGASETHAYRTWAGQWRASQAASERSWPLTLLFVALTGAIAYRSVGAVTRSPTGGAGGGGAAPTRATATGVGSSSR